MKVTILFGSPHKSGYTNLVLEYFLRFFPKCSLNRIYAYEQMVRPCIDCKFCKENKKCIFRDMDYINFSIERSDFIIIASPIYNYSFPSPLKAIFDRFQPYYFARKTSNIKKKKVIFIFTCGSKNFTEEKINFQIMPIIKIIGGEYVGNLVLKDTDNEKLDIDKFYIKSENIVKGIISNLNIIP